MSEYATYDERKLLQVIAEALASGGIAVTLDPGDVEIGAVEIKNGADDTRATVKSDGTNNALVVTQNSQPLPTGAATQTTLAAVLAKLSADPATQTTLAALSAKIPALGQALAAASLPVVLPATQITTLTPPAALTGFALETTQVTTNTEIGGLTETAPATDTASSGLNGRLQRIAQRLTSIIASTLGFSVNAGTTDGTTLRVITASDGPLNAVLGTTAGAKVITDANGSIQQYLRGLIYLAITAGQFLVTATGNVANGATDSGNPVKIGGKANAPDSPPTAVTAGQRVDDFNDLSGRKIVYLATKLDSVNDSITTVPGDSTKVSFSAAITGLAPAVAATDIFTIIGSASKTVRVRRIQISGVATAAGAYDINVVKRSTADTGGTSSAPTPVNHDSNDAAVTSVIAAYTANPTLGTLVGIIRSLKATVTTAAGAIPNIPTIFEFGMVGTEPIALRGVAQQLAINLNGATMTGGLLDIDISWTEE